MKANELRIGNFVSDSNFDVCITEICRDNLIWGVCLDFKNMNGLEIDDRYRLGQRYEFNLENIIPMPLTEGWLLKFGFKRYINKLEYDYRLGDLGICYDIDDDVYFVFNNSLDCQRGFKYVHQLQNLYFALTGEELTINE